MHIRVRSVQSMLVLFLTICPACFGAGKSLADLEREAKEVLSDPDNISRRKRIGLVFRTGGAIRYGRRDKRSFDLLREGIGALSMEPGCSGGRG